MRKRILYTVLGIAVIGGSLFVFYRHYQLMAHDLWHSGQLTYGESNAFKHAYAAAQITFLLRHIMNDEAATHGVLTLGYANEYFEQVLRLPRDSAPEVVKDLHNNQVGITAALWQAQHPETSLRTVILALIKTKAILGRESAATMQADEAKLRYRAAVTAAIAQFKRERAGIIAATEKALASPH